jgi:hypothetical protein
MNYVIALALLSTPAFAATDLKCDSEPVSFAITAPNGLVKGSPLTVIANGMFETREDAQIDMVESITPPLAVVDITTLDAAGKENAETSIRARIEIALSADGSVSGLGKIQITFVPALHPRRMLTRYDLNACTGTL